MAINANFYNFNGIDNGSDLDYTQAATDLNSDSFYDLTPPAGRVRAQDGFGSSLILQLIYLAL